MNADNIVRAIVIGAAVVLVGAFLIAGYMWPSIAGNNGNNLAIALPLIGGLAILAPIVVKVIIRASHRE